MSRIERVVSAALAVIPGPHDTITFVHQRSGPYAGHWLLPGGKIEPGETAAETARREAYEEVGVWVTDLRLFAVYEFVGDWESDAHHLLMFGFVAAGPHIVSDGFVGEDVDSVRQAHPSDIPLHATDLRILTDAGFAAYDEEQVEKALTADRITMVAHVVADSTMVRPDERG